MAFIQQPVAMLGIDRAAFRLAIGAMRAADIRAFIPAEPQPAQRIEDLHLGFGGRAHLIGILDPQQKLAAMLLGKAIVDQRDIGSADMRITGGRGRNAGADGFAEFQSYAAPNSAKARRRGVGALCYVAMAGSVDF